MLPDVRKLSDPQREALAWKVHEAKSLQLPKLQFWNYSLCKKHVNGWIEEFWDPETKEEKKRTVYTRPKPGCRECAIHFRKHQKISIAWLYLKKRALLADTMGTGKTTSAGGLLAMMMETGELGYRRVAGGAVGRAILVPRAPALRQWQRELKRMIPSLDLQLVDSSLTKAKRADIYSFGDWTTLLIGPEMLRNDARMLEKLDLALVLTDDIDALRNPDTDTSYYLDRLGKQADRYVIMTGTPLQKKLPEMHSILDGIGGLSLFGDIDQFKKRYIKEETVTTVDRTTGLTSTMLQVTGYRNTLELKQKMAPLVLRRTADDLDDVTMPAVVPDDVMLDLYPKQRQKYKELQKGVVRILTEEGEQVKHATALSRLYYGAAICGGLVTLGEEDAPNTSMKLDWVIDKVQEGGDLGDEKVVIFALFKNTIRALHRRLAAKNIGFETIWGEEKDPDARARSQDRFWDDPSCRILLGTAAIEQSLNLQVSRHLINIDQIRNQARMEQLAGRIRRDGSAHSHVFVHNLITVDTQEERAMPVMEREAALAGHILGDEKMALYPSLTSTEMLRLITG